MVRRQTAAAGYRKCAEIYEPGDSRVNISIEKFLGRSRSLQPFLKSIGIGPNAASARTGSTE